jgi:DNA uptake protein ComE-like DNA-binding protein
LIGVAICALYLCWASAPAAAESKSTTQVPAGHPPTTTPAAPARLVDINKASRTELKTLPGIGDAEADRIIANRPFLTKVDLVTLKIVPEGVYVSIRNQIVATQSGKLPQKK